MPSLVEAFCNAVFELPNPLHIVLREPHDNNIFGNWPEYRWHDDDNDAHMIRSMIAIILMMVMVVRIMVTILIRRDDVLGEYTLSASLGHGEIEDRWLSRSGRAMLRRGGCLL